MQAVKSVKQNYTPTPEVLSLLDEFRKMVNDCVRIGLAENATSMKTLSSRSYHQLKRYPIYTQYRLTAISKASGILNNYRKTLKKHPNTKKPYATKLMLTDCYGFKILGNLLRLPIKTRQYIFIPLNQHTLSVISGYTVRSVCLTACTMSIAFSKETVTQTPIMGLIGIDRNLNNVTTATLDNKTEVYDMMEATKAKALYREVKSHFRRNDVRVAKRIQQKYGQKQQNKVQPILHNVSKQIVEKAKAESLGIVMENLKGIQKLYRKGNGQGKEYRSRLNSWSFYELQRQIEYKAKWEGIPVIYVPATWTSSTCAICGSEISECAERKVWCGKCQRLVDRDENAALNIVKQGVRFTPSGFASEAMVKESSKGVILTVDANKLTQCGGINYPAIKLTEPIHHIRIC